MKYVKRAAWVIPAVVLLYAGKYLELGLLAQRVLSGISSLGPWAPVIFILAYIAACLLFIPGALLTLGAGAMFGLAKGIAVVSIGATFGASLAFLVSRYFARDWISRLVSNDARFASIDNAVGNEGWKIVVLTRLSPAFPFNLLNYAFGLTRVSLRDYFLASWIGMLPGITMYVYIGSLAGDVARVSANGRAHTPAQWALYLVGFAATIAVTVIITRIAKSALQKHVKI